MPRRKPKPPKPDYGLAIYDPDGQRVTLVYDYRDHAVGRWVSAAWNNDDTDRLTAEDRRAWQRAYREGYRCLRVRVEPITKKERP